mmetsp:Transcript_33890/g.107647  ORF Transcript_33890/g.107647 Transcript_33890/m.107647 type:complete len:221 (-) Transcript_33890:60-722(-)
MSPREDTADAVEPFLLPLELPSPSDTHAVDPNARGGGTPLGVPPPKLSLPMLRREGCERGSREDPVDREWTSEMRLFREADALPRNRWCEKLALRLSMRDIDLARVVRGAKEFSLDSRTSGVEGDAPRLPRYLGSMGLDSHSARIDARRSSCSFSVNSMKNVSISPLPLIVILPRGITLMPSGSPCSKSERRASLEHCTRLDSLVLSMRLAGFTVSPKKQ